MKWLALLAVLGSAVFAAVMWDASRQLSEPWSLQSPELIAVRPGQNIKNVLHELEKKGVIKNERAWIYASVYLRLRVKKGAIRAGEYQARPGMTTLQFLQLVISSKVFFHQWQVIEGWTFDTAVKTLLAHPAVQKSAAKATPSQIMALLGDSTIHAEGSLLPETYRFARGTTDISLLRQAREAMKKALDEEWAGRASDLPYRKPMDALIMASIVEKETGQASERAQIAGVFIRRLVKGMMLQTDPTVIYGMGARFDGNLRLRDLRRDTPYNTYMRYGLPPTPICLPGRAALHAALNPDGGDAVYFVARGDGSHQFSKTLSQHNDAVRRYQLKGRTKPSAKEKP